MQDSNIRIASESIHNEYEIKAAKTELKLPHVKKHRSRKPKICSNTILSLHIKNFEKSHPI